ncbi:M15 family metallopeptidase [Calidithermus chliarophilus]|uniref:M15 family metallopeptidase n=1 Tax=Calidithermus chliarophilus TaxID=52023 RepID=UPI00041E03CA|nr:M15 family metallopeptidase [Calidithermus chliarophilus]
MKTKLKLPVWAQVALPLGVLALLSTSTARKALQRKPADPAAKPSAVCGRPDSSRSEADLHPELAKRWRLAAAEYRRRFPDLPQPFLTQTYRSCADQNAAYAQGRTRPGPVVTNARAGESLHNYYPALAFDVAFQDGQGGFSCAECFNKFAGIAKFYGLAWGGDWTGLVDRPHFEPPNYSWQKAAQGIPPTFPPLPK